MRLRAFFTRGKRHSRIRQIETLTENSIRADVSRQFSIPLFTQEKQ